MLGTGTAFAQKAGEQEKEMAALRAQNAELSKQNLYYKQTLDLLQPLATASGDGIKFDIVKAVGSRSQKSLKIYYIYSNTNSEVRPSFTAYSAHLVDPQGNQAESSETYASNDRMRVEQIEPNTPMKALIKFKTEEVGFPQIKVLNLRFENYYRRLEANSSTITFKNIPVSWTE